MFDFKDRTDAGQQLASQLEEYRGQSDVLVLGLPRGGVPIAYEIAKHLKQPLDIFLVRKLGTPGQSELAMGAIALGDVVYLNERITRSLMISEQVIEPVLQREKSELSRRNAVYRGDKPAPVLENKTVILADDGIATGSTMKAAIQAIKQQNPEKIIVAVPGASPSICRELEMDVDKVVCVQTTEALFAVSQWYQSFPQLTDEEVCRILASLV